MHCPKSLTGAAAECWRRNSAHLLKSGLLNDSTRDAFLLLCQLWAKLEAAEKDGEDTIKYVCLAKQVQQLQKSFGMTPESRKRLKVDEPTDELDEWGLPLA